MFKEIKHRFLDRYQELRIVWPEKKYRAAICENYIAMGIGFSYEHGCLGTQYGDPRKKMYTKINILTPVGLYATNIYWKEEEEEE